MPSCFTFFLSETSATARAVFLAPIKPSPVHLILSNRPSSYIIFQHWRFGCGIGFCAFQIIQQIKRSIQFFNILRVHAWNPFAFPFGGQCDSLSSCTEAAGLQCVVALVVANRTPDLAHGFSILPKRRFSHVSPLSRLFLVCEFVVPFRSHCYLKSFGQNDSANSC